MSTKRLLFATIAATALIILVLVRRSEPARESPVHAPRAETPWLSSEAAAQIIGPGGTLGPLFSDVMLGGPAPSPAVRARIAEFARANRVAIEFEEADGGLEAIRFAVSFGGCCGYEGADVLALRLSRPSTGNCCVCGDDTWIDDWAIATDDGLHMRARVRINRVEVRWQRLMTISNLLERAESLLGMDAKTVRNEARDAWIEVEAGRHYRLEVPYRLVGESPYVSDARGGRGLRVAMEGGKIAEVSFELQRDDRDALEALPKRWGRPRKRDDTWTWSLPDRVITAEGQSWITIAKRGRRIP